MGKSEGKGAKNEDLTKEKSKPGESANSWRTRNFDKEKKTALGDTATIKRLLDDAAIEVMLDNDEAGALPSMFTEDTSMSNLKLFIGFSAVGASLLSHVYPAPFPRNWWCLFFCCAFYFVMSGVLQLLLSFVELESILLLKAKPGGQKAVPGLNVSSHFPRFQNIYTLGISPIPGGAITGLARAPAFLPEVSGGNREPHCAQRSWAVEKYFDEDGTFLEEEFMESVHQFVEEYTAPLADKKAQ